MNIQAKDVKELRELTGAGMMDCKKALVINKGNMILSKEYLDKKFGEKAGKKADRITNEGMIAHYLHPNHKLSSMVIMKCETDFVARNEHFKQFAQDVAMHVAAMNTSSVEHLLKEAFVKNPSITIQDYLNQVVGRLGENIVIEKFVRFNM